MATAQTRRLVFVMCLLAGVAIGAAALRSWGVPVVDAASTETASRGMGVLRPHLTVGVDGPWEGRLDGDVYRLTNDTDEDAITYFFVGTAPGVEGRRHLRVDVDVSEADDESYAGILYGYDPSAKAYYLIAVGDREAVLFRRDENGMVRIASLADDGVRAGRNTLELQESGDQISVVVNGRRMSSLVGRGTGRGAVGIAAWGTGSFVFTNFALSPEPAARSAATERKTAVMPEGTGVRAVGRIAGTLPERFEVEAQADGAIKARYRPRDGQRSAVALAREALTELAPYFDGPPAYAGGMVDARTEQAHVTFVARRGGRSISGLVIAQGGAAAAAIVAFDAADRAPSTLERLLRSGEAARPAADLRWQQVRLPDGSGQMRLPEGWRIVGAGDGRVDAQGPQGLVSLGTAWPVLTPAAAGGSWTPVPAGVPVIPYSPPSVAIERMFPYIDRVSRASGHPGLRWDRLIEQVAVPYPNGEAAFLHFRWHRQAGTGSEPWRAVALVIAAPTGSGQWMFYNSIAASREEAFGGNLRVLTEIWGSWHVDGEVFRRRLESAVASMRQAGRIWQDGQRGRQLAEDRALADWSEYMRGYRVAEDTLTGDRTDVRLDRITRLVEKANERAGWPRYQEIPARDMSSRH